MDIKHRFPVFSKRPIEQRMLAIDLGPLLAGTSEIDSVIGIQVAPAGLIQGGANLIAGNTAFSGQKVEIRLSSGAAGEQYLCTLAVETDIEPRVEYQFVVVVS